jgi:hypothetical protein
MSTTPSPRRSPASVLTPARVRRARGSPPPSAWPVTFVVVRNMSGIVSAPSRMPIPSTGIPAAMSTGTMMMIEPPGTPGTENDVTVDVTAIVSNCAASRSTP